MTEQTPDGWTPRTPSVLDNEGGEPTIRSERSEKFMRPVSTEAPAPQPLPVQYRSLASYFPKKKDEGDTLNHGPLVSSTIDGASLHSPLLGPSHSPPPLLPGGFPHYSRSIHILASTRRRDMSTRPAYQVWCRAGLLQLSRPICVANFQMLGEKGMRQKITHLRAR